MGSTICEFNREYMQLCGGLVQISLWDTWIPSHRSQRKTGLLYKTSTFTTMILLLL